MDEKTSPVGAKIIRVNPPIPRDNEASSPQESIPSIAKQQWYVELELETEGGISLLEALEKINNILELPKFYGQYKFADVKTRMKSIKEV